MRAPQPGSREARGDPGADPGPVRQAGDSGAAQAADLDVERQHAAVDARPAGEARAPHAHRSAARAQLAGKRPAPQPPGGRSAAGKGGGGGGGGGGHKVAKRPRPTRAWSSTSSESSLSGGTVAGRAGGGPEADTAAAAPPPAGGPAALAPAPAAARRERTHKGPRLHKRRDGHGALRCGAVAGSGAAAAGGRPGPPAAPGAGAAAAQQGLEVRGAGEEPASSAGVGGGGGGGGQAQRLAPVEYLGAGAKRARPLGELDLALCASFGCAPISALHRQSIWAS